MELQNADIADYGLPENHTVQCDIYVMCNDISYRKYISKYNIQSKI